MIEVLIADDQKSVREILRSYIEADTGLELVGCAGNGQEAIDLIKVYQPHIVLMDIEMPVMDGLSATQIISEQFINTNVLIITVHDEDRYLNTALQVGAKGYLKKNTPQKELINAIYSAYKGYFQLGPGLLDQYLYKTTKLESNSQEIEQLKSVILKQSQLLDSLNGGRSKQYRNRSRSAGGKDKTEVSLENRCATLEKQIYYISRHIEQLNKKIRFNQQLCILAILSCVFLSIIIFLKA